MAATGGSIINGEQKKENLSHFAFEFNLENEKF